MYGEPSLSARTVDYLYLYSPLLSRDHEASVGVMLYEAAAEQAYLIGWMAYDDGHHGLAQRYLIQALRLCEEARSPALGAHVLAGLSDQANLLGYPKEALALAWAGRRVVERNAGESTACLADLLILEARALAALGNAKEASATVTQAEQVYERVVPENEPEWARFIDDLLLRRGRPLLPRPRPAGPDRPVCVRLGRSGAKSRAGEAGRA
jgi:hypothetical protein